MSSQENIKIVRRAMEAFNTGDTTNVHEFISSEYLNRESQKAKDSYRSQLRGPEEFIDTIKNLECVSRSSLWRTGNYFSRR